MKDLIVFSVGSNKYALDIANIQRITQSVDLTEIPNAHGFIDGMMSYKDTVTKVLNFRKLIGLPSYNVELEELFVTLKKSHVEWVDALRVSLSDGSEFTKTFDPHLCELGKWLDGFTAYDDNVAKVLRELREYHKELHTKGFYVMELYASDKKKAQQVFDVEITEILKHTMGALDVFVAEFDAVANSLQKLLIYESKESSFAIKVDSIDDIAHVEEEDIMNAETDQSDIEASEFLELEGVLDIKDVLINVIKTIDIPS